MQQAYFVISAIVLCSVTASANEAFELPEDANDAASISWALGSLPLRCADVTEVASICTWSTRDEIHVACRLGAPQNAEVPDRQCSIRPDNTSITVWPITSAPQHRRLRNRRLKSRAGRKTRAMVQQEAISAFAAADTPYGVSQLLGVGPNRCSAGSALVCTWVAARRTPGYVVAARAADAAGKKVRVLCKFAAAGPSGAECRFSLADQVAEQAQ